MGKWATYRKRGSAPEARLPGPGPLTGDWGMSIEESGGIWRLHGQQLEAYPSGYDRRRYRYAIDGGSIVEGQQDTGSNEELTVYTQGSNYAAQMWMRWEDSTGVLVPTLWSAEKHLPN